MEYAPNVVNPPNNPKLRFRGANSCINYQIFTAVMFFAPWYLIGIQVLGRSIFLSFALIFVDFRFWVNAVIRFGGSKLPRNSSAIYVAALALLLMLLLRADDTMLLLIKICGSTLYTIYVVSGLKQFGREKSLTGLRYGITSSVLFASIQFVEANFFKTTYLIKDLFISDLKNGIILGLGFDAGISYAPMELYSNEITRVSGTAAEPGYYSLLMIAMLPIFFREPIILVLISIGLIVSFSKVTIFCLIGLAVAATMLRILKCTSSVLIISMLLAYDAMAILVRTRAESISNLPVTLYDRFSGYYIWEMLSWPIRLMGTGYRNACDYISKSPHPYYSTMMTKQSYGDPFCNAIVHSNIGSFQVEAGILGIGLLLCLFILIDRQMKRTIQVRHLRRHIYLFIFSIFLSTLSIHYTVFYPALYILVAYALSYSKIEHS